jgi:hypothetical protein
VLSKPITPKSMNVLGHGLALPLNRQSLDLATGPLINFGGASAAYSLRDLNGRNPRIVRVRRASDNHERDFYKDGINSGELTNWVNSQIVPPLDIGVETSEGRIPVPEGGTSIGTPVGAYSLRNLSTTYTGNVVDVRRSIDDAVESFTAAEVADGTLEAWVQSGNDNHATQGTAASQPKIVDGGTLVTGGLLIGSGQHLVMSSNFSFALNNLTSIVLGQANGGAGVGALVGFNGNPAIFSSPYRFSNTQGFRYAGESATSQPRGQAVQLFTFIGGSTTADGYANGTLYRTVSSVSTTHINKFSIGSYSGNLITGKVAETLIYPSDQSANRTAIEANIGETYGITGIPAYDNTVDGFVETWYDQSGNGNDATQSVAASQPKIVDAGTLATRVGQPSVNLTTESAVLLSDSVSITETESAVHLQSGNQRRIQLLQFNARHRTLFGNVSSEIYIGTPNADSQMSLNVLVTVKSFTLGLASLNTPNLHALLELLLVLIITLMVLLFIQIQQLEQIVLETTYVLALNKILPLTIQRVISPN